MPARSMYAADAGAAPAAPVRIPGREAREVLS
jgi:hypothetical protein